MLTGSTLRHKHSAFLACLALGEGNRHPWAESSNGNLRAFSKLESPALASLYCNGTSSLMDLLRMVNSSG